MRKTTVKMIGAMLAIAGSAMASFASAEVKLQGAGATFPNPVYQRWVKEYEKKNPSVKIDYQSQGSGAGIKSITEKTVAFAGSDAPLSKKQREEMDKAGLTPVHIPTVAGAVVIAYNLPGFTGELKLSGEVIADVYLGKITKWNDPKIAALNAGATLPDVNIVPAYRTDGSGTTFIFSNYLATQSEAFKESVGSGTAVKFPTGQGGKGNEGVTAVVKDTPGAFGYVELIYALANDIPYALVQNKDGQFVKASTDTVAAAGEGAAKGMKPEMLAVPLWNQPGSQSYPIAAFTYVIVYKDLSYVGEKEKASALVAFLQWATGPEGQAIAKDMGYAPLSAAVKAKVDEALATLNYKGETVKAVAMP